MLTPRWFIRQQTDIFYLEIDNYAGGILSVQLALEYLPWKNIGFGISADSLNVGVESENSDGDNHVTFVAGVRIGFVALLDGAGLRLGGASK